MHKDTTSTNNIFYLSQIPANCRSRHNPHHRIVFSGIHTSMASYGQVDGSNGDGPVNVSFFFILGNITGQLFDFFNVVNHRCFRNPQGRIKHAGQGFSPNCFQNATGTNSHSQVSFHGTVGELFFIIDDQSPLLQLQFFQFGNGGVDIRRRPANINQHQATNPRLFKQSLSQQFTGHKNRPGRGNDLFIIKGLAKIPNSPGVDNLVDKLTVNGFPGSFGIEFMDCRDNIGNPDIINAGLIQKFGHFFLGIAIAGNNHRGLNPGFADNASILQGRGFITIVGSTGQQDDIRSDFMEHLFPIFRWFIYRNHLHHPSASRHCHFFGSFGSHLRHIAHGHHSQSPGCTTGTVAIDLLLKGNPLDTDGLFGLSGTDGHI